MPSEAVVPAGDWPLPGPFPAPPPSSGALRAPWRWPHLEGRGPGEGWHRGQCSGEGQLSAVSGQHHCSLGDWGFVLQRGSDCGPPCPLHFITTVERGERWEHPCQLF